MSAIKPKFGQAAATGDKNTIDEPSLAQVLRDIADDLTALRAAVVGITAQLDADGTVTDTDYAANNDPAALLTTKT